MPVFSGLLAVIATETGECWCRVFPVFLTRTPIDDRVFPWICRFLGTPGEALRLNVWVT